MNGYFNVAILALLFCMLGLNYQILLDLFHKWYAQDLTGTYSHGLLVAIIVIYLVYRKLLEIRPGLSPSPSSIGFAVLLGSQGLLFLALLINVNFVQHIMLVVSLISIVWAAYSWQVAKQFVPAALLFSLSFPVWGDAAYPLQKVAIFTTTALLNLTWLPYYHEGALFHFPNGIIEIAPECAGLQQLLVSLIIGLLFSLQHHLQMRDIVKTLIYISLSAVLINTIRIIIIMIVGYYTKMESALITKHVLLGWVIYGIGIYIFLYFYARKKFQNSDTAVSQESSIYTVTSRRCGGLMAFLLVIVLFPSILNASVTRSINARAVQPVDYVITSSNWHKISDRIPNDWKPDFPPGDNVVTATYESGSGDVYLYISNYSRLQDDIEPINMDNTSYNADNWLVKKNEILSIGSTNVRFEQLVSKSGRSMDVFSYFIVNGKHVVNLREAKLATLFGMLRLNYDIKVVCLAVPATPGNTGENVLRQFYQALQIR